jgi:hypothetical protein
MSQTFVADDKVIVVSGPDADRHGTVVDNFAGVYGDDLTDGALVRFDDGKPSHNPGAGVTHEFKSSLLRRP